MLTKIVLKFIPTFSKNTAYQLRNGLAWELILNSIVVTCLTLQTINCLWTYSLGKRFFVYHGPIWIGHAKKDFTHSFSFLRCLKDPYKSTYLTSPTSARRLSCSPSSPTLFVTWISSSTNCVRHSHVDNVFASKVNV